MERDTVQGGNGTFNGARGQGVFVVSLDFEGYWGMRHQPWVNSYSENLAAAPRAAVAMLDLFRAREIHCTWAIVGILFAETRADLDTTIPHRRPAYKDSRLSPYEELSRLELNGHGGPLKTAPAVIRKIRESPGQEIATHTFSHFFCHAAGQTLDDFTADMEAARKIAAKFDVRFSSIVFPRNQCNAEYLDVLTRFGITSYRGTESSWLYRRPSHPRLIPIQRLLRLLDNYVSLTGHNTHAMPVGNPRLPVNLPSSRFLRPFMPSLRVLEPLRLARIKRALRHAARSGEIFHLWWHPHNFGKNLSQNLELLDRILEYYGHLKAEYGMKSMNMSEVTSLALAGQRLGSR
jgi:hypothetical protein